MSKKSYPVSQDRTRSAHRAISPRFAIRIELSAVFSAEALDKVAAVLVDNLEVDKRATGPKRDPVRRRAESAIVDAEQRDRAASEGESLNRQLSMPLQWY